MNGDFLLRIEDTDKKDLFSFTEQIKDSLHWLDIKWNKEIVQSERLTRHVEIAHELLRSGNAYRCFCTQEEIKLMQEEAKKQGIPLKVHGEIK